MAITARKLSARSEESKRRMFAETANLINKKSRNTMTIERRPTLCIVDDSSGLGKTTTTPQQSMHR